MKKLLVIAPALAILTACSSAPVAKPDPAQVQATLQSAKTYKCDKSTEVVAVYGNEVANLKVTAPSLSLNQTALMLKQTMSASGVLYTAQTADKATTYDWHMKGNEAMFTVSHNGTDYDFSCQMM